MVWPLGRHRVICRMKGKSCLCMVRQAVVTLISLMLWDTSPECAAVSCMVACNSCAMAWGQNALGIASVRLPRGGGKGSEDILRLLLHARGGAVHLLLQRLCWQG